MYTDKVTYHENIRYVVVFRNMFHFIFNHISDQKNQLMKITSPFISMIKNYAEQVWVEDLQEMNT